MIIWETFKTSLSVFNSSRVSQSLEQTAQFYSNLYFTTVSAGTLLPGNTLIPNPGSMGILYNGFLDFFESNYNLQSGTLTTSNTSILSDAIIDFWEVQVFNPLPPHPPATIPTTGVQVNFYGVSQQLAIALLPTFITGTNDGFISAFTSVLQTHISLINGVYNGTIATPTGPVPVVVPWVGVF